MSELAASTVETVEDCCCIGDSWLTASASVERDLLPLQVHSNLRLLIEITNDMHVHSLLHWYQWCL